MKFISQEDKNHIKYELNNANKGWDDLKITFTNSFIGKKYKKYMFYIGLFILFIELITSFWYTIFIVIIIPIIIILFLVRTWLWNNVKHKFIDKIIYQWKYGRCRNIKLIGDRMRWKNRIIERKNNPNLLYEDTDKLAINFCKSQNYNREQTRQIKKRMRNTSKKMIKNRI